MLGDGSSRRVRLLKGAQSLKPHSESNWKAAELRIFVVILSFLSRQCFGADVSASFSQLGQRQRKTGMASIGSTPPGTRCPLSTSERCDVLALSTLYLFV
jgi:hypothetical protein